MRIGVVSDSHGYLYSLDKAISRMGNIDMIIHAGDGVRDIIKINAKYNKRIEYVRGNNDIDYSIPSEKEIIVEGVKIFITHGYEYRVHLGLDMLYFKNLEINNDIVIYGHTHNQSIEFYRNSWYLNPGSTSFPRLSSSGFAVIEIIDGKIDINLFKLED